MSSRPSERLSRPLHSHSCSHIFAYTHVCAHPIRIHAHTQRHVTTIIIIITKITTTAEFWPQKLPILAISVFSATAISAFQSIKCCPAHSMNFWSVPLEGPHPGGKEKGNNTTIYFNIETLISNGMLCEQGLLSTWLLITLKKYMSWDFTFIHYTCQTLNF